jgi:WD40 repeat protein
VSVSAILPSASFYPHMGSEIIESFEPRLELLTVLEGHTDRVWYASWHPTRDLLATASGDKTVRIWQPKFAVPSSFSADSSAATSSWQTEPTAWRCIGVLDDFTARTVRCVEWSPDGRYLACTSFDGKAYVWVLAQNDSEFNEEDSGLRNDEISLELMATLEGHENEVKACSWSPSGSILATCGRDKSVWLWSLEEEDGDLEVLAVLHGHSQDVKCVRWHPNRELLFSASYDDTIKVWAETASDWVCIETLTGHDSTVWDLAFDPSGTTLASVSDDLSMKFWTGKAPGAAENPMHIVDMLKFAAAGAVPFLHTRTIFSVSWNGETVGAEYIATCGADDSIRICTRGPPPSDDDAALDPSTASLSKSTDTCVFHECFGLDRAHTADVNCVRWHPKASVLVSCGDDNKTKIWKFK